MRLLVLSLVIGLGFSQSAMAQNNLAPEIDFGVRAMQGAQFIQTDGEGPASEAAPGFQRVRWRNSELLSPIGPNRPRPDDGAGVETVNRL